MKKIPLFGNGIQSYSAVATAQRRLNCFYDPRPDQDKSEAILRGTPGSTLWLSLPVYPIRGWIVSEGILYIVAKSNLYSVTSVGTFTYLGAISTNSGLVEMATNTEQIIIVDGTAGYIYTVATATLSVITDVNFPNGAITVDFIDGVFVVEKPNSRQFYISQVYDGTLWTPVQFATKESESSNILAVSVMQGMIVLYGASGLEFWQPVTGGSFPYQRINGAQQTWGIAAVNSRVQFSTASTPNSMMFLGQNPQGHIQVLLFNGYTAVRVSTSDVENIINSFDTYSDAIALTYMIDGHSMYQITFPTGNRSFLFDGLTGLWSEVQTGLALLNRHFGNLGIVFGESNYISDATTGNIYILDPNAYTDNGTLIKRQVRTRHLRNAGNIFGVSELYLDMATGTGAQSGGTPILKVQVSKDNGRTFGKERQVSLGDVGEYKTRIIMRRWGTAIDFVWQFTVTAPVKFLITSGSATAYGAEGKNDA